MRFRFGLVLTLIACTETPVADTTGTEAVPNRCDIENVTTGFAETDDGYVCNDARAPALEGTRCTDPTHCAEVCAFFIRTGPECLNPGCIPVCENRNCGFDPACNRPCGDLAGACPGQQICAPDLGLCENPDCDDPNVDFCRSTACGPAPGCPNTDCGPCTGAATCTAGQCRSPKADCELNVCGPDGIGGSCGTCNAGSCVSGQCISGNERCVKGRSAACRDANGTWDGNACCLSLAQTCVDGFSSQCDDPDEAWTGELCCVDGALCVEGSSSECDDENEHWTGKLCCVTGKTRCTDGPSKTACTAAGGAYTGTRCCE